MRKVHKPSAAALAAASAAQAPEKRTPAPEVKQGTGDQCQIAGKHSEPTRYGGPNKEGKPSLRTLVFKMNGMANAFLRDRYGLAIPEKAGQGGPCPVCGGDDRFNWFMGRDGRIRYFCRREGETRDLADMMVAAGCVSSLREAWEVLNGIS
ncbi:primase-helicase zinc-binding domain-containing protein [Ruegeria arenilitoris]|uniref:primase-helicase zinc-binding domain-containing protein n=1 Tax=Ruegeria arenilitoris TaxID=1173585 RepID=UPI003CC83934